MKIAAVTSCNRKQWYSYGLRMAESFVEHWPADAKLYVYGDESFPVPHGVTWAQMPTWFEFWKLKHADNENAHGQTERGYNFKKDCVRFAHKVAALTCHAERMAKFPRRLSADLLIWMDIDTLTDKQVTADWLCSIFPDNGNYMAWLDRARTYPECGFMMFRPEHRAHKRFMEALRYTYESDSVFDRSQTHDSYVIQQVAEYCRVYCEMPVPYSLSGKHRNKHHPFVHSELGTRMDHLKGDRKIAGKSPERAARV